MRKIVLIKSLILLFILALTVEFEILSLNFGNFSQRVTTSELMIMAISILPLCFFKDFIEFIKEHRLILILLLLFLLAGAVSTLFSPLPKIYTLKWLIRYFLVIASSFILFFLFSLFPETPTFFFKTTAVVAIGLAIISIAEASDEDLFIWLSHVFRHGEYETVSNKLRASATFLHPNIFACFLSITVLIFVYLKQNKIIGYTSFLASIAILTLSIALSSSRNAIMILVAALCVLSLNKIYIKISVLTAMFLAINIVVLSPYIQKDTVKTSNATHTARSAEKVVLKTPNTQEPSRSADKVTYNRVLKILDMKEASNSIRLILWQGSFRIFLDHPIAGIGAGGCYKMLKQYVAQSLPALEREKLNKEYLHAHNGILQLLAEFGILGTSIASLLFLAILAQIAKVSGLYPPSHVHAITVAFFLSFVPDAFVHSYCYMILFISILLVFTIKTTLNGMPLPGECLRK